MKRTMQKSLAVLLAVVMTFGALPLLSVGFFAFAADRLDTITAISLSFSEETMEAGKTKEVSVSGSYTDDPKSAPIPISDVWLSSSDPARVKVENGVLYALEPTETGKPVTIHAQLKDKPSMVADAKVYVVKAPVPVDRIEWEWDTNAFLADTGKEYSFAYVEGASNNVYRIYPSNADVKTATLSCFPTDALEIDNVKKTFKVNKLPAGKEKLVVTLVLKADGASAQCKEANKEVTVYNDVPITGIHWLFSVGSTNKTLFKFYESSGKIATYYYMPTVLGNPKAPFKYETIPANENFLELCEITVSSSDKRIITFYEPTGQIVPLGNGEATLTVKIVTPKGKTYTDTVIGVVQGSPYTAITSAVIGYDEKNTDSDAEYDKESNTLTLMYNHGIQLTANLNDGASLTTKGVSVQMDDGTKKSMRTPEITWSSDNTKVAEVDENGKVTVRMKGTATITMSINDNGKVFENEIVIKGTMTWWQIVLYILIAIFTFHWGKVKDPF